MNVHLSLKRRLGILLMCIGLHNNFHTVFYIHLKILHFSYIFSLWKLCAKYIYMMQNAPILNLSKSRFRTITRKKSIQHVMIFKYYVTTQPCTKYIILYTQPNIQKMFLSRTSELCCMCRSTINSRLPSGVVTRVKRFIFNEYVMESV